MDLQGELLAEGVLAAVHHRDLSEEHAHRVEGHEDGGSEGQPKEVVA